MSRQLARRAARLVAALVALPLLVAADRAGAEDLFALRSIPSSGRSVAAELADVDGDGRVDLFVVVLDGVPPEETRTIHVYLQRPEGDFPEQPDHRLPVPQWSALYDVGDVRPESPGAELVLLGPSGITLLSLADASGRRWYLPVAGPTSFGPTEDERGLEHYRMVYAGIGAEPWLLVPQIGQMSAITASGMLKARLDVPRRANFFVNSAPGLVALESDLQLFVDHPKVSVGDVDGDGAADFVAATRHELRVFLARSDGSFAFAPDRSIPLRMVTPRDHIRGSGGVASDTGDVDGDGRLDLLVTHTRGSMADATTVVALYRNVGGGWDVAAPDQRFESDAAVGSNAILDVDGDGRPELVRLGVPLSVLEVVEILVSREVDVELSVHRVDERGLFSESPWFRKKFSVPFSFETFRPNGFLPTWKPDLNGDGIPDFVSSGNGQALEVHVGSPEGPFASGPRRQAMSTAGMVRFADFDGDGLQDFVVFDPHNFDVPVQLGRNLGRLPGTRARLAPAEPTARPAGR